MVVVLRARGPVPLGDRDTWFLLSALKARANPLFWFTNEWPLQNGFYRPITALSFELDLLLLPASTNGYGLSAALYCAACVLSLFWLARELTDNPMVSVTAALLFAFWHSPIEVHWDWILWVLAAIVGVVGLARHGKAVGMFLPAVLSLTFVATELRGVHLHDSPSGFAAGVLYWVPSRTATLMTLFSLCALASYARYLRGVPRTEPQLSPLDLPATKSSLHSSGGTPSRLWLAVSILCVVLALGSYEQAIMLPAVLLLIGLVFRTKGYVINWWWHAAFWGVLAAYLVLRDAVVPIPISTYVDQQLRTGTAAYLSALNYLLPCSGYALSWYALLPVGSAVMMLGTFYSFPYQLASNVTAYVVAFRQSKVIMFLWLTSVVAFLPMAFLKPFAHYHYWAMSLRALFIVLLVGAVWKMVVSAVSPQTVRAPLRPSPAPGSLLHP